MGGQHAKDQGHACAAILPSAAGKQVKVSLVGQLCRKTGYTAAQPQCRNTADEGRQIQQHGFRNACHTRTPCTAKKHIGGHKQHDHAGRHQRRDVHNGGDQSNTGEHLRDNAHKCAKAHAQSSDGRCFSAKLRREHLRKREMTALIHGLGKEQRHNEQADAAAQCKPPGRKTISKCQLRRADGGRAADQCANQRARRQTNAAGTAVCHKIRCIFHLFSGINSDKRNQKQNEQGANSMSDRHSPIQEDPAVLRSPISFPDWQGNMVRRAVLDPHAVTALIIAGSLTTGNREAILFCYRV